MCGAYLQNLSHRTKASKNSVIDMLNYGCHNLLNRFGCLAIRQTIAEHYENSEFKSYIRTEMFNNALEDTKANKSTLLGFNSVFWVPQDGRYD